MLHPRIFPYVRELKELLALAQTKERHEARGETELAVETRVEMFAREDRLSPEARHWWFGKSSDQLAAHLRRFVPAYKWNRGRNATWVGRRWVRNSQTYGTRICNESNEHDRPATEYTLR